MASNSNYEFEQVIDAFSVEEPEEIVHIIQGDNEEEIISQNGKANATLNDANDKDDLVILVPPLLTAGREQDRISISLDEVRRRVEPPEKLCASNLLNLFHLSKHRTPELKETLSQYGLTKISKRSAVVSSFSKLSETEASHVAEDFFFLSSRSLKLNTIGEEVAKAYGGWDQLAPQAEETKALLNDVLSELETTDKNLNLATHGFSPLIVKAVVNLVSEILTPKGS